MARDFDTAMKTLIEGFPRDWLRLAGIDAEGPVEVVNANLASIQVEADKVIRVLAPKPHLVHFESESNYKRKNPEKVLVYNVLLRHRSRVPVTSVLVLLRRKADGPAITGKLVLESPSGGKLEFEYGVLRIWELTENQILAGGPGIWPLLPLVQDADLASIQESVEGLEPRVERELAADAAGVLWTTMFVLAGLRFDKQTARAILNGVRRMKESTTYQAILEEGHKEHALQVIRTAGTRQFGKPTARISRILRSADIEALNRMIDRMFTAESWDEVIDDRRDPQ